MILDSLLVFDPSATGVQTTTNQDSTNIIPWTNARDMGIGDTPALKLAIFVTTAFVSTNSATLQIKAQQTSGTVGGTYRTIAESMAYSASDLLIGAKLFPIDWPHRGPGEALPTFAKLNYTAATGSFSIGALTAYLVLDRQDAPAYPSGINITN